MPGCQPGAMSIRRSATRMVNMPRDEGGDGFCEVHVNTIEGFWSLLRSWLRPHRGISQDKLPQYLGFFQFVHNARRRGKALLDALVGALIGRNLSPPRTRKERSRFNRSRLPALIQAKPRPFRKPWSGDSDLRPLVEAPFLFLGRRDFGS